jgi:uncharacterized protein YoxC
MIVVYTVAYIIALTITVWCFHIIADNESWLAILKKHSRTIDSIQDLHVAGLMSKDEAARLIDIEYAVYDLYFRTIQQPTL